MLRGDVFVGKIVRVFPTGEKEFKGQLEMPHGAGNIFLHAKYGDKLISCLKKGVGKFFVLSGDIRFPGKDAKNKTPILEISRIVSSISGTNGDEKDTGNSVTKYGRITKDVELAYTPNSKQYCKGSIAINYGFGDNKETDFTFFMLWGNDKEKNPTTALAEKGAKGQEIIVHGQLQISTDTDGKIFPKIIVTDYLLVGTRKKQQGEPEGEDPWAGIGTDVTIDDEDEIPF